MSGATFNEARTHRTRLWRRWDESLPWLNLIGLNPSKAGEVESDPTITRQIERAKRFGCGGLLMANAYDLISTDPMGMLGHANSLTDANDIAIVELARMAHDSGGIIIAGWGRHCDRKRQRQILDLLSMLQSGALV